MSLMTCRDCSLSSVHSDSSPEDFGWICVAGGWVCPVCISGNDLERAKMIIMMIESDLDKYKKKMIEQQKLYETQKFEIRKKIDRIKERIKSHEQLAEKCLSN